MEKFFKWFGIIVGSLILIGVIGYQILMYNTKRHSPAETIEYSENGQSISIDYCRPYKKGRDIFGGLVPYGETWRTGANEATTFVNSAALIIDGKTLSAGEYTLWTVPGLEQWEIILNAGEYGWGVGFDQKASRDPQQDVIVATAPVEVQTPQLEQFTIAFEDGGEHDVQLTLQWDETRVILPIDWAE